MLSQASIYIRYSKANAALMIDNLKELLQARGGRSRSVMQRMYRYPANITISPPFWYASQEEVQAIFAKKGSPTLYFPLSAAGNHWKAFHRLMPTLYGDPAMER